MFASMMAGARSFASLLASGIQFLLKVVMTSFLEIVLSNLQQTVGFQMSLGWCGLWFVKLEDLKTLRRPVAG